ncbi:TIGR00266 family protein [Oscillospiraceae bacterium WX1]
MRYNIVGDSLPVVICTLDPGEIMISQAGGRTWCRGNVVTDTTSGGGARKILGRMLTGESLFLSQYTANGPCEIAFASSFPGRIIARQLAPGEMIVCQKRSFLAATAGVDLAVHFQKKIGAGIFGGEGFIMQRMTGPGLVFLEIDGHCVEYTLAPGEPLVCDTGVLAAMDATCGLDIQMVKGLKNVFFGGEGLFDTIVTGPGKVYLQSMSVHHIANLIYPYLPKSGGN